MIEVGSKGKSERGQDWLGYSCLRFTIRLAGANKPQPDDLCRPRAFRSLPPPFSTTIMLPHILLALSFLASSSSAAPSTSGAIHIPITRRSHNPAKRSAEDNIDRLSRAADFIRNRYGYSSPNTTVQRRQSSAAIPITNQVNPFLSFKPQIWTDVAPRVLTPATSA